jgi:hypothetical protein
LQFSRWQFNLEFPLGSSTVPDEKRIDPFKPQQPQIPGVAAVVVQEPSEESPSLDTTEQKPPRKRGRWIAAILGCVLIIAALFGFWSHASSSPKILLTADPTAAIPEVAANTPQPTENLPMGPGEIATTEELSKAWSSKRFLFRNQLTQETTPAMVVHLPGGEYWAFSLREPFGSCDMEFVTDLQKLQTYYNFRSDHPMVGDPCDRSVFDLTRYGTAPSGLVRGEIAQGSAIRPPVAIEIRTRGNQVLAVRTE